MTLGEFRELTADIPGDVSLRVGLVSKNTDNMGVYPAMVRTVETTSSDGMRTVKKNEVIVSNLEKISFDEKRVSDGFPEILKDDLYDLLDDLRDGWRLCAAKGMGGYDLSEYINDYIVQLMEKDLEG